MTGEISNLYGANLYGTNLYGSNMYSNNLNATANNDDFLAQQYFAQMPTLGQPVFQGYQQPQIDTFEKSNGSGLGSAIKLGTIAGLGTGAGVYFFGTNPIKDGKVDENLIKSMNKTLVKKGKLEIAKELYEQKAKPTFDTLGIKDLEQYNAIKKLANVEKLEDLPEDVRKLLPDNIKTPADAKAAVELAKPELDKIDIKKIAEQSNKAVNNAHSIEHNANQLKRFEAIKTKIEALPKDAKVEDLKKFFIDNAETFKLKGSKEEIAAKAEKLAAKHGTKEHLLNLYQGRIDTKKEYIDSLKSGCSDAIKENLDESKKALKEGASKEIKEAFKSFKWNKALKYGGIAAAAGLVISLLTGSSSKS